MFLRIEMDRGNGGELRSEGTIPANTTMQQIERSLASYAVQYPHRALLDGVVVATAQPTKRA